MALAFATKRLLRRRSRAINAKDTFPSPVNTASRKVAGGDRASTWSPTAIEWLQVMSSVASTISRYRLSYLELVFYLSLNHRTAFAHCWHHSPSNCLAAFSYNISASNDQSAMQNLLSMVKPCNCQQPKIEYMSETQWAKTYNSGDSLVVTDPTTNPPVSGLTMGERTGSRIFHYLWSRPDSFLAME
ncbi:uncharacterized protein FOBCDRAFT_208579 [Fusarium oxysporum Fo47]|uniref:uncharacterized protein n=1 Tax=Fusarium oxysporum Fo47 TaxID=660027 RepID=UPI002869DA4F|nr:uncharacterized protein FOBCDRAFT_208579 [Fusarium oxysporum Fo47]QJS76671.2 hypothetical protein FOBCDRAFT_208579 [Fusarium oxysporum Fo47]